MGDKGWFKNDFKKHSDFKWLRQRWRDNFMEKDSKDCPDCAWVRMVYFKDRTLWGHRWQHESSYIIDFEYRVPYIKNGVFGDLKMSRTRVTFKSCLLYTSPSPRDQRGSRMPSSA